MLAWIAAAVVMFGCSYFWHGVILNDYERLNYPKGIFLVAAGCVYLFIAFLLTRLFHISLIDKITLHPLLRGPIAGVGTGLMVYMIAIVVGITINHQADFQYMLFDVLWQLIEQAIGGLIVGLVFFFVFENVPNPERVKAKD